MKYAMTIKTFLNVGFWEDCAATTEKGAKREASQRFFGGYLGDIIELAIKHDDGQYQTIAKKVITRAGSWRNA